MTVREAVNAIFRYLRTEQRVIPFTGTTYDDPLPDVLDSFNAALQIIAMNCPLFAAKKQRSVLFRAPATMSVSGLTNGGMAATGTFPAGAAGCWIQLPGDPDMNRIISINGTTATLQFPHLSADASGTATINYDSADIPADVITVHEPVRFRNSKTRLVPASSRATLAEPMDGETRYFIESSVIAGAIVNRMMLSGYFSEATVVEFEARVTLGTVTQADVYDATEEGDPDLDPGVSLPVPADMVEAIFLPIATDIFFSKPSVTNYDIAALKNEDATKLIRQQAANAMAMLAGIRPQGNKPARIAPAFT